MTRRLRITLAAAALLTGSLLSGDVDLFSDLLPITGIAGATGGNRSTIEVHQAFQWFDLPTPDVRPHPPESN